MGSLFIVRDGFSQLADIQIVHWRFILHGFFRSAVFANQIPSRMLLKPMTYSLIPFRLNTPATQCLEKDREKLLISGDALDSVITWIREKNEGFLLTITHPSEVISSPLEAHKFIYLRREDVCGKALLKILTGQSRYDDFITIRGGNVLRKPSDIFNIVSKTPPAE